MGTSNLRNSFVLLLLSIIANSCSVISGIFKAGMGFGIFIAVVIVIGIVYLIFSAVNKK